MEDIPFPFGGLSSVAVQTRRVQARILARISTKEELFDAFAVNLGFRGYLGNNWHALQDCLRDLSWLQPFRCGETPRDQRYLRVCRAVTYGESSREHELSVAFPKECETKIRDFLSA